MNILSTVGHYASRRTMIVEANAAVGPLAGAVPVLVRFVRSNFTVTPTLVTVDARTSLATQKSQLVNAAQQLKGNVQPPTPTPKPGPAPVPTAEPTVYFRTEDNNLFHKESHTGIEPAEFYAVRSDAVNAGLTPDGACGA